MVNIVSHETFDGVNIVLHWLVKFWICTHIVYWRHGVFDTDAGLCVWSDPSQIEKWIKLQYKIVFTRPRVRFSMKKSKNLSSIFESHTKKKLRDKNKLLKNAHCYCLSTKLFYSGCCFVFLVSCSFKLLECKLFWWNWYFWAWVVSLVDGYVD